MLGAVSLLSREKADVYLLLPPNTALCNLLCLLFPQRPEKPTVQNCPSAGLLACSAAQYVRLGDQGSACLSSPRLRAWAVCVS